MSFSVLSHDLCWFPSALPQIEALMAPQRYPISPLARRTEGSAFDTVLQSLWNSQRIGIHCLSLPPALRLYGEVILFIQSDGLSVVSNIRPLWMKCGSPKVWKTVINRGLLFHQLRWVKCHAFRVFQFNCGCMNGNSDLFRYFHFHLFENNLFRKVKTKKCSDFRV